MDSYEPPDPSLTTEEQQLVSALSESEIREVDQALLSRVSARWQKVAMVVATTMLGLNEKFDEIPDIYFGQRIRELVKRGILESQGDLSRMRYSEIRLNRDSEPGR